MVKWYHKKCNSTLLSPLHLYCLSRVVWRGGGHIARQLLRTKHQMPSPSHARAVCKQLLPKPPFFRCVICRSIWHAQCCDAVAFSIIQKVSSTGSSGSGSDVHGIVYNRSDTDREHVAGFLWNVLRERLLATESSTTAVTMERLGSWRNISAQGLLR